jgi:hypothetical protein
MEWKKMLVAKVGNAGRISGPETVEKQLKKRKNSLYSVGNGRLLLSTQDLPAWR